MWWRYDVSCVECNWSTEAARPVYVASHLSANHMEEYTRSFGGPASSKKQTTLPTIVHKCSAEHAAAITRLIAEFVAKDLHPLSIVLWWQLPTTSEHHRARVPSVFAHSRHHGLSANLPDEDLCCTDNGYLDQPCYTGVPNHGIVEVIVEVGVTTISGYSFCCKKDVRIAKVGIRFSLNAWYTTFN